MNKNNIKILLKFVFAFGLIYWLVQSGKLDFNILAEAFQSPARLISGFLMTICVLLIVTLRYRVILDHKMTKQISFLKILKYNWIGMFFNSVLPGAVSGDIVKIFYIKEDDKELSHRFLFASILIDRFVGLFGLIIILGTFTIFNYTDLTALSMDIKKILDINIFLFACVLVGLFSLFFFENLPFKITKPFLGLPLLNKILPKLLDAWKSLCEFRKQIIALTILSILVQFLAVIVFWFIVSPFADGEFLFSYAFSIVPIGFVALAIPIAPSGLGVGHAVFHSLFGYIGVKNGASLFNIYFFVVLFSNLLGSIPYLLSKSNKINIHDLEELAEENA